MNNTEHFKDYEFMCPCCGVEKMDNRIISMLETLRTALNAKSIVITSGYRCEKRDREVGGIIGMHNKGGACDIIAYKKSGERYSAFTIAEQAEKIGFTGIGIIDSTACHVDIRGTIPYSNNHWFGNEQNGETYTTFSGMGEKIENVSHETLCPHCGKKIKIERGE